MIKTTLQKNINQKEADKFLATLRNRKSGNAAFRNATRGISLYLMRRLRSLLRAKGVKPEQVIVVIILRAAVGMLPTALEMFPGAPVGVLGLGRNERTKHAFRYLEKLPPISKKNSVVLLDPMLATGGSAETAVEQLKLRGADPRRIYFVGIIGAPEGLSRLARQIPKKNIVLAALDERLDKNAMIVPGLGDFGDRYFGNVSNASFKK